MKTSSNTMLPILILMVVCALCFFACSPYPHEVEYALSVSGNNKVELIKVLEHYKNGDQLKFKAACFLISNMPYHKSKLNLELSEKYFKYFKKVDSIGHIIPDANHNDSQIMALSQQFALLPPPHESVNLVDDVRLLTAEFLIENIEEAFYQWRHSPLLKNVSFEEFKEWILPYRTIDESLAGNKLMLKSIIYEKLSVDSANNIRKE